MDIQNLKYAFIMKNTANPRTMQHPKQQYPTVDTSSLRGAIL
jgi:hypothetical protein